ncbi:MAG: long-chain fatty acid--CoA ligase [Planctomycetota bacterium]
MKPRATQIPAFFKAQAERLGGRTAVLHKQSGMWVDVSWSEWRQRVDAAARGWLALGVGHGERIAVLSENRLDGLVADLAIMSAGAVVVPLHASLPAAALRNLLVDSGAAAIVVADAVQAEKMRAIADDLPALRCFVAMDPLTEDRWRSLANLEQLGRAMPRHVLVERQQALHHNDLASIIYTSGTTGTPKGAMLTHGNLLANALAMNAALGPFPAGAVFLNWLPFSHVYARTVDFYLALAAGGTLALAESAETVVADLLALQPVHLSAVPRFYEKVLGRMAGLPKNERHARLRAIFGSLGWLGCGGAVMSPEIAHAYREAGLEVIVGYGLTECSPVIATNRLGANKIGTVGQAIPGVEVRIADDGEVLTRGPHVMPGYWNQPEATAAILRDGWLHTGDLGSLDADGFLSIHGRKKDLIVLSNGKKVAPAPLEGRLANSPRIEQAAIFGDGRPYLTAVIVPREGGREDSLLEHIDQMLEDVAPWEKVRKIVIASRPFSVNRDEITISMKLRRDVVFENFRREIDDLYDAS